jgi:hypothetical protein
MEDELIILKHGEPAVRMARELSENCPPNYFIVEDHNSNTVYYKLADPPHSIIKTPYTDEHIRIAHRSFLPQHERYIRWDELNSQVSKGKRDYYVPKENTANGVSAVKAELAREFRITDFPEYHNIDMGSTILRFDFGAKHYTVEVADNFRDDYASGQIRLDLKQIVPLLRASSDDRIFVSSKGIDWNEA